MGRGRLAHAIEASLLGPLRAFRIAYLPLITIYLASGALGLVAVADSFWVKKSLTLTPADLAALAVWLQLPWTAKMVISELVDAVPLLGSQRRIYIVIGAALIASGLLLLAGAAAGWLHLATPEHIYVLAQLLIVIGGVLQEVVADAVSAEVVPRCEADGSPRPQAAIDSDLAAVQVQARLGYSIGAFAVGWVAGVLAERLSYATVFLIGLGVPALTLISTLLMPAARAGRRRPVDWRILGGGAMFAAIASGLGLTGAPLAQEIVFVLSLAVIGLLMARVMDGTDPQVQRAIAAAAFMIFAFRMVPTLGDGYRWFTMDVLGFDERFFGVLQLTGTGVGLVLMWLMAGWVVGRSVEGVLVRLTLIAAVLWIPSLLLVNGLHHWSDRVLGIGARSIALIDEAAQSPLALLATVPLLTLIARHAPPQHRATWFALAASLMSLAIVAGQLATKYLNVLFPITRGDYAALPALVLAVIVLSLLLPITAIAICRHAPRQERMDPPSPK